MSNAEYYDDASLRWECIVDQIGAIIENKSITQSQANEQMKRIAKRMKIEFNIVSDLYEQIRFRKEDSGHE
jgi:hypothetical protein